MARRRLARPPGRPPRELPARRPQAADRATCGRRAARRACLPGPPRRQSAADPAASPLPGGRSRGAHTGEAQRTAPPPPATHQAATRPAVACAPAVAGRRGTGAESERRRRSRKSRSPTLMARRHSTLPPLVFSPPTLSTQPGPTGAPLRAPGYPGVGGGASHLCHSGHISLAEPDGPRLSIR